MARNVLNKGWRIHSHGGTFRNALRYVFEQAGNTSYHAVRNLILRHFSRLENFQTKKSAADVLLRMQAAAVTQFDTDQVWFACLPFTRLSYHIKRIKRFCDDPNFQIVLYTRGAWRKVSLITFCRSVVSMVRHHFRASPVFLELASLPKTRESSKREITQLLLRQQVSVTYRMV